jgi:3-phenylpropionate/trans-cinnamate dioxygenase ferredoxin subunit
VRVEIGAVDTLPRNRGVLVSIGDDRIALFRIDDEVFAIADRCSHAEASLAEGEVFDHEVECPRHGSEFDLRTGKALSLPATKPVATYEVFIEDGIAYLNWEPS